eukprot:GHRR01024570.1.p1 GENE.GHRR01024570.1~~GHRR01024570.1.p1  ORF type:complete len:103 (+),score=18.48 GHRR01024570.1:270-578(+)
MFSPVDQVLLSCSGDRLVKMWSVRDGSCLRTFEGHAGGVLRCMFLTAGTQVLSAGGSAQPYHHGIGTPILYTRCGRLLCFIYSLLMCLFQHARHVPSHVRQN